jgi:hypothetical protein
VRWVTRFAAERADAGLADLRAAVDALDCLPEQGSRSILAALLAPITQLRPAAIAHHLDSTGCAPVSLDGAPESHP